MVYFAITGSYGDTPTKHSRMNAEETGEFVVNMVAGTLGEKMNITTAVVAYGVDEMKLAGLQPEPCRFVKPPRGKESPVSLGCRYWETVDPPGGPGDEEKRARVACGPDGGLHYDQATLPACRSD